MSLHFRLYPPFLHVPEENSFTGAWEAFSCKLLNLEHGTTAITRRAAPDQGVDLYWPAKKIAYQCKSVESGKSGDFDVAKAIASYRSALKIKSGLGWTHYTICTNVAITGTASAALRNAIPGVEILPQSHWVHLCETKELAVARNFRTIVDLDPGRTPLSSAPDLSQITTASGSGYTVMLYCNRHDSLYRLPVHDHLKVSDLVLALRNVFRLPAAMSFSQEQVTLRLSHAVAVDGRKLSLDLTLAEAGVGPGTLMTYWTTIVVRDDADHREFDGHVIHMATAHDLAGKRSYRARKERAVRCYEARIAERFAVVDEGLGVG